MDINQYKEQFVTEARDHIDNINDNLLILEKAPKDEEAITKLFRSFHTLKGNAATMGYQKFSEIAHHLEDVLDKIRGKQLEIDGEIMDLLFEGIDILDNGLQMISDDKSEEIDDSEITPKVKGILERGGDVCSPEKQEDKTKKGLTLTDEEIALVKKSKEAGKEVYDVCLTFEKDNSLKGVKALIVLRDLGNVGEVLGTHPVKSDVTSSNFDTDVDIVFATIKPEEDIKKVIEGVSAIKCSTIKKFDLDEAKKKTSKEKKETAAKEADKAEIAKQQQDHMVKQIKTVKIDIQSLDNLMNLVGELLISKIRLEQMSMRYHDKELDTVIANLTRLTVDIQDEVMKQRMIPIGNIFNRFPRMVRDLAKKEKKKINLIIEGDDIEFDRTVLDEIGDPLVHLLRNCVDHGIELPEERTANSKVPVGTVKLVAKKAKSNAIIEITDDGWGIDPQKVKESSVRKGLISQAEADSMDDKQALHLIFRAGVSTNKVITDVSGRGVGMDVVESKIKALGGNVKLDSTVGEGTVVRLQLPLTLAIINSLLVVVDGIRYAVPLSAINRTVKITNQDMRTIQGNDVFLLMNEDIPLVWLSNMLHSTPQKKDAETYTVVIVDKDDSKIGLVVDYISSQQQILIKSLDDMVKGIKGLGGATILGDGRVAMILDVATLFE